MIGILLNCALAFDFSSDVEAASAALSRVERETESDLIAADLAAAQAKFLAAVPEASRTAAFYFVVGNQWFSLDHAFARRMHGQAYELAPDEPFVVLEWALERQRAGEWSEALPLWTKLVALDAAHAATAHVLETECLVELGRMDEATAAWSLAQAGDDVSHARMVLGWVHAEESPIARRARLLGEIARGDVAHAEDLVLGDVFWSKEGKHHFLKYEYLEHDHAAVAAKLDAASERAADLKAFVDVAFLDWEQNFPRRPDCRPRELLVERARARGWTGATPRLPAHDRVAAGVVRLLLEHGVRTPAELEADFGAELTRRARVEGASPEAARVLVEVARAAKSAKLAEYEALVPADPREALHAAYARAPAGSPEAAARLAEVFRAEFRSAKPDVRRLDRLVARQRQDGASPR